MRWIAGAAAALAFLAAGYALGRMASKGEAEGGAPSSDLRPPAAQTDSPCNEFLAALRSALQEPRLLDRTLHTAELLSQLSAENAAETLAVFESEQAEPPLMELAVESWVRIDGQGAFEHFLQKSDSRQREVFPRLLEAWASSDPSAARDAYESVKPRDAPKIGPLSRPSDALLGGLLRGWARSGKPGLTDFFSLQSGGSRLSRQASFYLQQHATQNGFAATADFADQLASDDEYAPSFKRMMLGAAGEALAGLDCQRAGSWAMKYAGDPLEMKAAGGVSKVWLSVDPEATMQWLASLTESKVRDDLVDANYEKWLKRHQTAAMEWAAQVESSLALEPVIARYASELAATDPQSALVQVGSITNAKRRTKSLIRVAEIWYEADPGPATAWLEQSELDDEQREQVVASAATGGNRGKRGTRQREKREGKQDDLSGIQRGR